MANSVMDVVELANQYGISADGEHGRYEMMIDAAREVNEAGVPGLICEIGVRAGFGIFSMMVAEVEIESRNFPLRHYIGIDPYGQFPIPTHLHLTETDYTLRMKNNFLKGMYTFCMDHGLDFSLMCMESTEFIRRFDDGFPVYTEKDRSKNLVSQYAVVHIDGVHNTETVLAEAKFFGERLAPGGFISFDNWDVYDNGPIDEYLSTTNIVKVKSEGSPGSHCKNLYKHME